MGKIVELDKAAEYALLFVFGDTASRIGYVEIKHLVVLQLVAKTDTAFLGKLDGIGHQIDDELRQAVTLGMNVAFGQFGLKGEGDILSGDSFRQSELSSSLITLFNSNPYQ